MVAPRHGIGHSPSRDAAAVAGCDDQPRSPSRGATTPKREFFLFLTCLSMKLVYTLFLKCQN
ncbi:hypothetical protein Hanom_Chr01g00093001 [Helianthus anomalus]